MAATTTLPASDSVEGAPRVVAGRRRSRLDAPSRPPATTGEAVELADLTQALIPDSVDGEHHTFTVVWAPAAEKLVRDGIPDIIRRQGLVPVVHPCADVAEHRRRLIDKAGEEANEYAASLEGHLIGDLSELADLAEVVEALAALDGYSLNDVLRVKAAKQVERGGFTGGLVWCGNITPHHMV